MVACATNPYAQTLVNRVMPVREHFPSFGEMGGLNHFSREPMFRREPLRNHVLTGSVVQGGTTEEATWFLGSDPTSKRCHCLPTAGSDFRVEV